MPDDVTLKTVLDTLAAMEQRMSLRFDGANEQMTGLERKIQGNETKLSRQIDAIDSRLDDIEIETLPNRVAKLEASLAH